MRAEVTPAEQLVSIIVPVFNAEEYLQRSVSSLLGQSHAAIEVILVDDGSADRSLEICRELAERDSRIKVLSNGGNKGQEAARNYGLETACGDWIMFLDADDMYEPDGIEKILRFARANDLEVVIAPFCSVQNGVKTIGSAGLAEGVYTRTEFADHCLTDVSWPTLSCIGSKLYRADFIRDHNIFFDKRYQYNEDGAFILKVLSLAQKVGCCDAPFYLYLMRETGSSQSSYRPGLYLQLVKRDALLKAYLEKCGNFTQEQKNALDRMMMLTASYSLHCEVKFGSYKGFRDTLAAMRKVLSFKEQMLVPGLRLRQKAILLAMRYRLDPILFLAMKLR